jgi:hypothetical protein
MVSFFSLFCLTSFLLESSAELARARGRILVGEELSDRDDFFVGDVDGETCAAIGIMPGMWPAMQTLYKYTVCCKQQRNGTLTAVYGHFLAACLYPLRLAQRLPISFSLPF